jgi:hypothetical protein
LSRLSWGDTRRHGLRGGCPTYFLSISLYIGNAIGAGSPTHVPQRLWRVLSLAVLISRAKMQYAVWICICKRRHKSRSSEKVQGMFQMNASGRYDRCLGRLTIAYSLTTLLGRSKLFLIYLFPDSITLSPPTSEYAQSPCRRLVAQSYPLRPPLLRGYPTRLT